MIEPAFDMSGHQVLLLILILLLIVFLIVIFLLISLFFGGAVSHLYPSIRLTTHYVAESQGISDHCWTGRVDGLSKITKSLDSPSADSQAFGSNNWTTRQM
jgi:hypothetical protein